MVKNLLQDMIVNKSPRNEKTFSEPKKKIWDFIKEEKTKEKPKEIVQEQEQHEYTPYDSLGNRGSKYGLWGVALFAVVILIFALSFLFSKAIININPKIKPIKLNQVFTAIKENDSPSLTFDLVAISGEETKLLQATDEKDGSERARGTVVIFNKFSTSPQPLAIDTRLEGSNGKLYKTEKKLTVPGMKNGVPGSIEAKIYAAQSGEGSNSGPLDFKIFGFKGTPKYDGFDVKSKGEIKGGYNGKFFTVKEEEKSKYLTELKNSLQTKLLTKARDQIPAGFVLYDDAVSITVESESTDFISDNSNIPISMRGTLYGFLVDEKKLTEEITKANVPGYDDTPVHIPNIKNLKFSIPLKDTVSFKDTKNINFRLEGETNIVWDVEKAKILEEVKGKKKKYFYNVLSQYPNIDSADLVIKPVWKNSFPEDIKKIKIVINEPK